MLCSDVRAQLLAPEGPNSPELWSHLAGCSGCAAVGKGSAALDGMLRSTLLTEPPAQLQARLLALQAIEAAVPDAVLQSVLLVEPPRDLQTSLLSLVQTEALVPDAALRSGLIVEPPAALQASLLGLVDAAPAAAQPVALGFWERLRVLASHPSVLAAQFAALLVLAYAIVQVGAWLLNGPLVLGDVPYAIELLLWSPAVDYLAQIQGLLQQLGLWLLVAAAGWLVAQGLPWQRSAGS